MCGCSNFVNNDEKEFITQAESNRQFDFTGNRPSVIDFGNEDNFDFTGNRPSIIEVGEDPSFDFTGNRPSVIEVGEDPSFDFLGRNRKAKKDLRARCSKGCSKIVAQVIDMFEANRNTHEAFTGERSGKRLFIEAEMCAGGRMTNKSFRAT